MELLLVEVPTPFVVVSGIRSYFPSWVKESDFLQSNRLLRQFQYEQRMPSGKRRKPFTLVDTNHTSIRNMLLSLEMVDRVDQSRFTFTEWLQNTLTGWWTRLLIKKLRWLLWENNFSEIIEKDMLKTTMNSKKGQGWRSPSTKEINDQQKEKRMKTKWPSYFWLWTCLFKSWCKNSYVWELFRIFRLIVPFKV